MSKDDRIYYCHRAAIELELATRATRSEVIMAHSQLAAAYLDRVSAADDERRSSRGQR